MLDRQDIDALLISALYGELTPADEARLAAHLESHPRDRTALADLTRARNAVHASRILEVQLEPPQSVSALLLQEAARRAPRRVDTEKRSWLQRIMMSFVAHPAMAAAATLVLVVGVAGSMYMRNGADSFSDKTVASSQPKAERQLEGAPATTTIDPAMKAPSANQAFDVDRPADELAKNSSDAGVAAAGSGSVMAGSGSTAYQVRLDDATAGKPPSRVRATTPAPPAASPTTNHASARDPQKQGIVVAKEPPATPRDFEDASKEKDKSDKNEKGADASASNADVPTNGTPAFSPEAKAAAKADTKVGRQADQKPGDTKTVQAPSTTTGSSLGGVGQGAADRRGSTVDGKKLEEERRANEDLTWAKAQFEQAKSLVKAQKCAQVAPIILAIQKRTPDFYNQSVATSIELKTCRAYVDNARDRDESQKSRAKRAEPAPTESMH